MSDSSSFIPEEKRPGRAARSNTTNRFEPYLREAIPDAWGLPDALKPVKTEVSLERPRKVLTRNTSPDLPFDRSINPYRGCEHGCIYCFARPSHAYLGLSPGLDFETKLIARPEAPDLLRKELSAKRYEPATLAIGTNTDPYQPIERDHRIMRGILQVLRDFRHPVGIVTKGTLIERDIDVLSDLARQGLTHVGISVTTLDPDISRTMEPRVPLPKRRIETIRKLSEAGIPVRVMISPVVPGLTDHELESILDAARDAGAQSASWIALRLPREVAPLFEEWLTTAYPDRAARVLARVKETHGGKLYDPEWGRRMTGQGLYAQLIAKRFHIARRRLGFAENLPPLRTDLFRVPPKAGDQMDLFAGSD